MTSSIQKHLSKNLLSSPVTGLGLRPLRTEDGKRVWEETEGFVIELVEFCFVISSLFVLSWDTFLITIT